MAGANANANAIHHNTKHQKKEKNHEEHPNKFNHNFLYKAALVAIFLVIIPLFPSQAPEFINQSLITRSWELLHLLLVGIAISYGLFSSRNNEADNKEKENNNMSKFDNAQILVSRLLHVSSFFEDEEEAGDENSSSESDDHESTKVQTWNSQHYRNKPVVVVAPHEDQGGVGVAGASASASSRIGEKPLFLPVRSLKSRLSDDDHDVQYVNESQQQQPRPRSQFNDAKVDNNESSTISSFTTKTGSKRFARNSSKGRNDELFEGVGDAKLENKMKDSVVLASPIPWRSRSGRLESKQEVETSNQHASRPSMEESEFNKNEPRLVKSQSSLSSRTSPLPSPKFTHSESVKESLAKNAEDLVRKKIFYNKNCPPPPPPPPPMFQKPISMKPRYGSFNERAKNSSFDKELKRSISSDEKYGMKMNRIKSGLEVRPKGYAENMSNIGKSVRTMRSDQNKALFGKEGIMQKEELEDEEHFIEEPTRKGVGYDSIEFGEEEEKESFLDKVVRESYDEETETEDDEDVGGKIIEKESAKSPPHNNLETSKTDETSSGGIGDEGPDVDKKADEFIAKFREQIRLQRIESIKRSTTKMTRNSTR